LTESAIHIVRVQRFQLATAITNALWCYQGLPLPPLRKSNICSWDKLPKLQPTAYYALLTWHTKQEMWKSHNVRISWASMRRGERNKRRKRWEYQETDRWLVLKPGHFFSAHSQRIYLLQRVLQTKIPQWLGPCRCQPWNLTTSSVRAQCISFFQRIRKARIYNRVNPFSVGTIYGKNTIIQHRLGWLKIQPCTVPLPLRPLSTNVTQSYIRGTAPNTCTKVASNKVPAKIDVLVWFCVRAQILHWCQVVTQHLGQHKQCSLQVNP